VSSSSELTVKMVRDAIEATQEAQKVNGLM